MLTIGDKQFRNLQEQVLKNQEDIKYILEEEGVLNEFGIKVVGHVNNINQLPQPSTYVGEYGDAYAVGTETPYELYIWTRDFSGAANPFWFNIGKFPLQGPQGIQGPIGPTGATGQRGSNWTSDSKAPTSGANRLVGDQALNTATGDVYQYNGASWVMSGNIKGPQGIQGIQGIQGPIGPQGLVGPQGPKGDMGQFLEIVGELGNTSQLPDAATTPRSNAYMIPGSDGLNHLWALVGTTDLVWTDIGTVGLKGEPGVSIQNVQLIPTGEIVDITGPAGPPGPGADLTNYYNKDQTNSAISSALTPYATKEYVNDAEDTLQAQIDSIDGEIPKKLEVGNIQAGENITIDTNGNDITISAEGGGGSIVKFQGNILPEYDVTEVITGGVSMDAINYLAKKIGSGANAGYYVYGSGSNEVGGGVYKRLNMQYTLPLTDSSDIIVDPTVNTSTIRFLLANSLKEKIDNIPGPKYKHKINLFGKVNNTANNSNNRRYFLKFEIYNESSTPITDISTILDLLPVNTTDLTLETMTADNMLMCDGMYINQGGTSSSYANQELLPLGLHRIGNNIILVSTNPLYQGNPAAASFITNNILYMAPSGNWNGSLEKIIDKVIEI